MMSSSYGSQYGNSYGRYNKSSRGRNSSNGWSGSGYDRWVERNSSPSHNSTLGKVQRQFWFTKSAVMRKLGKNQDEHIVASDAELDAKMELFKAIESSTKELQLALAEYQGSVCVLAQEENAMGRLLKDWGRQDRGTASQVMTATGKSLSYTAQQRLALRSPLVRLFQEVDTFQTRAIEDTGRTLAQMEKMRTEYRGALMWMKNISQDFNPDQYSQLEKFRQVQETVRQKKAKFDVLKIKSIQKIDLLAASRCNMFSHALIIYQNAIILFSEKTAKTLNTVASNFRGYQHYNFQVIKELAEPEDRRCINDEENERSDQTKNDDRTFFGAEYHDDEEGPSDMHSRAGNKTSTNPNSSDSLLNLYEESSDLQSTGHAESTVHDQDLLSGDTVDSEKDTQKMLKDLFDSPDHKPLSPMHGPGLPVGDLTSNPGSGGPGSQNQPSSRMFMPSQLLDFGMLDWNQGISQMSNNQGAMNPSVSGHFSSAVPLSSSTSIATFPPGTDSTCTTSSTGGQTPGSATSGNVGGDASRQSGSSKSDKLDWYRVFQDIDPLSDPSNSFFTKKGDGGSC
ncbi:Islet cell autoantigen Ica1 C-terminal [Trinorchestia longiramus]|nr:Islet cell autoantigen Ica1 C-terminal [Trinorchestia longiramus]